MTGQMPPASPDSQSGSDSRKRTVIQIDIRIEGDLSTKGILELGGVVVGNVTADTLVITKSGQIEGSVTAKHVTVDGHVKGAINADNITVKSTGTTLSDITYGRITVETGAHVVGNLKQKTAK